MRPFPILFDDDRKKGRGNVSPSPSRLTSMEGVSASAINLRHAGQVSGRQFLNLVGCSLILHVTGAILIAQFGLVHLAPTQDRPLMVELQQVESAKEPEPPLLRRTLARNESTLQPNHSDRSVRSLPGPPPVAAVPVQRMAPTEARLAAGSLQVSRPDTVPITLPANLPTARHAMDTPAAQKPVQTSAVQQEYGAAPVISAPPQPKSGEMGNRSDEYRARIRGLIEQHKEYPVTARRGRMEGLVSVRFVLNRTGVLRQAEISRSSGRGILDRAALQAVEAVGKFPPVPEDMQGKDFSFDVPVRFMLRD